MTPPIAGPKARAALNWAEFSVTALSSASRGTSSETNACHEPIISPANTPEVAAMAMITPGDRTPAPQAPHRAIATAAWAVDMTSSTVRRSKRSARVPPTGPSIEAVMRRLNEAKPTHAALSVRRNTT